MSREKAYLERVSLLVGEDVLARLGAVRVLLFGCGGVARIPGLQDKLVKLARGGFKHHTSIGVGHMKSALKEAFTTYLGYDWIDIDA